MRVLFLISLLSIAVGQRIPSSSRSRRIAGEVTSRLQQEFREAGLRYGAPVFLRSFKYSTPKLLEYLEHYRTNRHGARDRMMNSQWFTHSSVEVWVEPSAGQPLVRFAEYPVCKYSGKLGPKLRQGDKQTPEGFYGFRASRLNPNSNFRLSFNIGYPNEFDRTQRPRRTGGHIMWHGDCGSVGCYALADWIDDVYTITSNAFSNGQSFVHVHSFPFPMTDANIEAAGRVFPDQVPFWRMLQPGYLAFEANRRIPKVSVRNRRYIVEATPGALSRSHNDRTQETIREFNVQWDRNEWDSNPAPGFCPHRELPDAGGVCRRVGLMDWNAHLRRERDRNGGQVPIITRDPTRSRRSPSILGDTVNRIESRPTERNPIEVRPRVVSPRCPHRELPNAAGVCQRVSLADWNRHLVAQRRRRN